METSFELNHQTTTADSDTSQSHQMHDISYSMEERIRIWLQVDVSQAADELE